MPKSEESWHIGDVRTFGGYYIYDGQGRLVAECRTVQGVDILANAQLIAQAPDLYGELVEADRVICELCKIVNPQHATADYGKGCNWCEDRESRLKAITKAEGK